MTQSNKKKNIQHWSWTIIISFFILGALDIRFGILGFICMGAPIYHALKGEGKIHCSKYCPRGSFLGRFMKEITFNRPLPPFMRTKMAKHVVLSLMITVFTIAMVHSQFEFTRVAFALFRFMGMSFIVGILMGIFFKPRSWCQVCPMGHAAGLIANAQKEKLPRKRFVTSSNE